MAKSTIPRLEMEFVHLMAEAYSELMQLCCASLCRRLLPEPILIDHYSYIKSSIQRSKCILNLMVFFRHLNLYLWNFFEYELLALLIEKKCSLDLKSKMATYAGNVERFQQQVTVAEFINSANELVTRTSIPPGFKDIVTEHNIDPEDYTLSQIEGFRKDIHRMLNVELSECALQMYSIQHDHTASRVVIKWIFPDELTGLLFNAEYPEGLMQFHHIEKLLVDGRSLDSVSLL